MLNCKQNNLNKLCVNDLMINFNMLIDYNVLIWKKCTLFLIIKFIIIPSDEFSITDIQVHRA